MHLDDPGRLTDPAGPGLSGPCHRPISRRAFLGGGLAAAGTVTATQLIGKGIPFGGPPAPGTPVPIPNGITVAGKLFHVFPPGSSAASEESTIYNANGFLGVASINGQGLGTTSKGSTTLYYGADIRFIDGEYVDTAGRLRHATFGFV